MNLLITSASRKVGLIRAFQRALFDEGGGEVVAIDANPLSAALHVADKAYVVPSGLGENFLAAVLGICEKHGVRLLVPTRDEELPFFAEMRARFREAGVTVVAPGLGVVKTCQDKRLFIDFCLAHGFVVPKTYASADDVIDFPVFVKERFGKGSKWAFSVRSREELDRLLYCLKEPIIQEYIDAREYTVDLFADFEGRVLSVVPRERLAVFGGESFVGRTQKHWPIIEEAMRLASTLGLIGHNTIQCFWHHGAVKFIEVNPRFGGGAALSFAAGAFTPRLLVRVVLGREVEPAIGEFEDGLVMLRYTEDLYLCAEEVGRIERFH